MHSHERFDALVVGAGPAGSVAALVLARGGARVALVDKARFPRDKACGDLVGPRGLQVLADLGIEEPSSCRVGDMIIMGPTGRSVRLPSFPGRTYPDHAAAMPRARFDAILRDAALASGAEPVTGRVVDPIRSADGLQGFMLSDGRRLHADVVIGGDGALSRVATAASLVDPSRVLWGFAVSAYIEELVRLPHIVLWEPEPWRIFPGYGWLFPGVDGCANVGLGLGLRADRSGAMAATDWFDAFIDHLRRLGVLSRRPSRRPDLRGGWLKMGMIGTIPARRRTLLVGDAAGLVNPLQGEGISQAMRSGCAAAEAVLAGPDAAATRYRAFLAATYAPYESVTAAAQSAMLKRPRLVSVLGRVLTASVLSHALRGGWSIYWNDLLEGAAPSSARNIASLVALAGPAATSRGRTRRWFTEALSLRNSSFVTRSAFPRTT